MIDQELISNLKNTFADSLINRQETSISNFYKIKNGLSESALNKLQRYILTANDWSIVDGQNDLNRRKISWDSDSIIEEIHIACESLTSLVNKIFSGQKKQFDGIQLWKDEPGYFLDYHTDNPRIAVSMQWYLFNNIPIDCGTTFGIGNNQIILPFINNTGYLASGTNQLMHKTTNAVPHGVTRYSLYSVWVF